MSQNVSSAVVQRRVEARDSLEDFPTPPWATRALCKFLISEGHSLSAQSCAEPAANRGHMVRPLLEQFGRVLASDVHDYGVGFTVRDYLFGPACQLDQVDWTVTNPPFRLAEQFIARALELSRIGVAVFVRSAFLEGVGRYDRLFRTTPPTDVLQFAERVVLHKGRLAPEGSTATAYCWLVWQKDREDAPCAALSWIAPCRKQLESAGDYTVEVAS